MVKTLQKTELDDLFQTHGIMYFKGQDKISKSEVQELDKIDLDLYDQKKTQSQRLRDVLFILWNKDNKGYKVFKDYYAMETNRIIEHYKTKLLLVCLLTLLRLETFALIW